MSERATLNSALRAFAFFANPEPARAMRDAAAQIEADGKRIEALEAELKILRAQVSSDNRPGVTLVFP